VKNLRRRFLLSSALLLTVVARADNWAPNLTLATTWDSNLTNADVSTDRIGALGFSADVVANDRYALRGNNTLLPGLHFAATGWPRFESLTSVAGGLRGEWQHKFGLGALAPVFSLELAGDLVGAREAGRSGTSSGATLALRKRLNDAARLALTQEFSRLDARYAVYDRQSAQTTLELGYDFTDVARVTLGAFWRTGDVLSYATPPRPELAALAPNRLAVETFRRPMVAYSIDAHTVGGKFALVRAVTDVAAVILSYEYRDTTRGPLRYTNHLVSLSVVRQF
jgi:hypothetical protein